MPLSVDDYKGESVGNSKGGYSSHTEGLSYEKQMHSYRLDAKVETKQDQQMYSDDKLYPGGMYSHMEITLLIYPFCRT